MSDEHPFQENSPVASCFEYTCSFLGSGAGQSTPLTGMDIGCLDNRLVSLLRSLVHSFWSGAD
ncbi:MAG: hypothetical protein Q8P67_07105 [archaeon]|nr:hypothetical protein [archaeon]